MRYQTKRIITLEMSCPWITNRTKKTVKKTLKYKDRYDWNLSSSIKDMKCDSIPSSWMSSEGGQGI